MYTVYVLENKETRWYIGHTDDLSQRLFRHNNNLVKSTKNRGLWKVVYTEKYKTRAEAMRREEFLKSGEGRKFLKEIIKKRKEKS